MTTPTTVVEVLAYLGNHATAEEIQILGPLTALRRDLLETAESARIRKGANVKIRNLGRPACLNGLTGTVSKVERYRGKLIADIDLDAPSATKAKAASKGEYEGTVTGVPIICLALI
jgi:hypothetical protein